MKIVVLDGATLNPGDLSWEGLEQLGKLAVYNETPLDLVVERARAAEVVLTNKAVLDADVLNELDELKFIAVLATGFDVVDVVAARERGIVVSNVPSYATDSVAQHTFALLLQLTNRVAMHDAAVRRGEWPEATGFTFWNAPLTELAGKTLGIVGHGRIGHRVAQLGEAFGMKVRTTDSGSGPAEIDELFASSDVVTLHCPHTAETENLVDAERIRSMRRGSYLINTARGALVDSAALADALQDAHLAGAALDVVAEEPIGADHPLLDAPNVVVTPHNAWTSRESRQRLMDATIENVRAFLAGTPANVVP